MVYPLAHTDAEDLWPPGEEALMQDAKMYASRFGVDLDEAIRRLKLQSEIGDLNAELAAKERDTFAGLWIQHQPEYRVIVRFTRNGGVTIRPYIENGPLADIIEIRTASVTLAELEADRDQAARIARGLGIRDFSAINIIENRAELYVLDPEQLNIALRKANLQLPANVEVIKVNELPREVDAIFGGLALTTCTSGFSVKNSSGTKGITTAGHCRNSQQYHGVNLPLVDEVWSDPYDIQWHTAPGFTVRNLVFDGTYARPIYGVKFRASQSVGEWVCKYGKTTHYGCGQIVLTNFQGVNVAVDIPVDNGDSGGPWFWYNTAYGTTKYACTFGDGSHGAIYVPVDQIYGILGLTILTN